MVVVLLTKQELVEWVELVLVELEDLGMVSIILVVTVVVGTALSDMKSCCTYRHKGNGWYCKFLWW